jgi:hypothetical protein
VCLKIMNDPHVENLTYDLRTGEGLKFENAPPLKGETISFRYKLDANVLTILWHQYPQRSIAG